MYKFESCKDWREKAKPIKQIYAAQMKENPTPPEVLLWERLCRKQLGVKFRQQIIIRGYIADFYCGSRRLAIEVDGKQHDAEYDQRRDWAIRQARVRVLRFPASRIFNDIDAVVEEIKIAILSKAKRELLKASSLD